MMTAPRTLHSHLVWPTYNIWSIELLPRSCAVAARDRVLRRWTTSLYVKLLLPSLGRLAMRHLGVIIILIHVNCEFKAAMQPRGISSLFSDNRKLRPF